MGVEVKDNKWADVLKGTGRMTSSSRSAIKENKVETNNASITYNWAIDM